MAKRKKWWLLKCGYGGPYGTPCPVHGFSPVEKWGYVKYYRKKRR